MERRKISDFFWVILVLGLLLFANYRAYVQAVHYKNMRVSLQQQAVDLGHAEYDAESGDWQWKDKDE